jgi:hypothetical protein
MQLRWLINGYLLILKKTPWDSSHFYNLIILWFFMLKVWGVTVWDLEWLECVWTMNTGCVQMILSITWDLLYRRDMVRLEI